MNGIEKIIQRIDTEAQMDIDRILGEARASAGKITARYQAQADAEKAELAAKNERMAAEREERLVSAAQMEARKTALAAKQEMVEMAYTKALESLCAMPIERYTAVLADLLVEASAGSLDGEVVFSPEDRQRVGKAVVEKANAAAGKQLVLSEETAPIKGGFLLKSKSVEVNCTFETLVRLQKAETAGAVAKKLFPEA